MCVFVRCMRRCKADRAKGVLVLQAQAVSLHLVLDLPRHGNTVCRADTLLLNWCRCTPTHHASNNNSSSNNNTKHHACLQAKEEEEEEEMVAKLGKTIEFSLSVCLCLHTRMNHGLVD